MLQLLPNVLPKLGVSASHGETLLLSQGSSPMGSPRSP